MVSAEGRQGTPDEESVDDLGAGIFDPAVERGAGVDAEFMTPSGTAQLVVGQVASRGEQPGAQAGHRLVEQVLVLPQPRHGLLDDIVGAAVVTDQPSGEAPQDSSISALGGDESIGTVWMRRWRLVIHQR